MADEYASQRDRHVVECTNSTLPPELYTRLDRLRKELFALERAGGELPVLKPSVAYETLFLLRPDATIQRALQTVLTDARTRLRRHRARGLPFDAPGYEYAFWVRTDPPDIIKIGRTEQQPRERIAQWEDELSPEPGNVVQLLFAFPTRYNVLAESLIHTALECEHLAKRKNRRTGRRLTEFFEIDNVLLLRLFMALVVRFADAAGDQLVAEAR